MEEKISVTFKAGTGYDVPWVVLKAASIQEMAQDLAEVQALFADVSYLSKSFEEAYKSAPKSARELVQNTLGAQHVTTEPVTSEPAMPWDEPASAAPAMPWESGPSTVVAPQAGPVMVTLPYAKKEEGPDGKPLAGSTYAKQMAFKDYFFKQRNKLTWNSGRKGFEFSSPPTPELLAVARQGAASLGGTVVE